MNELLAGSAVIGGFVGGVLALLAPCCITVLLPAYFASSFRATGSLVRMTFVFGAGIAAVIVAIAIGLSALGQLFSRYHALLFVVGGAFLTLLGLMTLRGRGIELPVRQIRGFDARSPASIFALGAFSGAASSCCAPVLIGVLTLTALTSSFAVALAVALAYVFGMVFPLFILALAGDRYGWAQSRIVRGSVVRIRLAGRTFSVHSTNLVGGLVFVAMGLLVLALAVTGNEFLGLPVPPDLSAQLQELGDRLVSAVGGVPNIAIAVGLAALAVALWRRGSRPPATSIPEAPDDAA